MKNWSDGVLALLMLMLSWPCWAGPSQRELEDIQAWEAAHLAAEQTIPALLERYGNAIGCAFAFNPGNVVKYRIQKQPVFVAVISLDVGCSGGTSMSRNLLVTMKYGDYHRISVDPERSRPSLTPTDFPKRLERLYVENGEILFSDFKPDWTKDALCCATQPVKGKVSFSDGGWQVVLQP